MLMINFLQLSVPLQLYRTLWQHLYREFTLSGNVIRKLLTVMLLWTDFVKVYYVLKCFSIRKKAFQSDGQSFVSSAVTCHGQSHSCKLIFFNLSWCKGKFKEMKNDKDH